MGFAIQTEDELEEQVQSTVLVKIEGKSYPFIILDRESKYVVGSSRIGNINLRIKILEIEWAWYRSNYQGTDIKKAWKYELLKYVLEQMQFNRVQLSVYIGFRMRLLNLWCGIQKKEAA